MKPALIAKMRKQAELDDKVRAAMMLLCAEGTHERRMAWSETKISFSGEPPGPTRTQWYCRWCKKDLGITEEPGF